MFSDKDGLPIRQRRISGPPEKERKAVAVLRAKFDAMKRTFERSRKPLADELRKMLAGERVGTQAAGGGGTITLSTGDRVSGGGGTRTTRTNLFLRAQMGLKGATVTDKWATRYDGGDLPGEITDEIESFHERLAVDAEIPREFADALDDGGTIGPMVIYYGIDRKAVNRAKAAASSTPIDEVVSALAGWEPGMPEFHPEVGMDFMALATACRAFAGDAEQVMNRTIEQLDQLERVAKEAMEMWLDEMDVTPSGYEYGTIKAQRLVYGEDCWWDSRVVTRWQDATCFARRIIYGIDEIKKESSFKKSAVDRVVGVAGDESDGWTAYKSDQLSEEEQKALNENVPVVEFWDKTTGEVHYFTETAGYDGFLEKDSVYPYLDAKGRSIFKDWFPMRACIAVVDNMRRNERTFGKPWLEAGRDHAIQYVLFDTALTASRSKAGRIVEYPDDLPNDVKQLLESGSDLVLIPRPAELGNEKPLIHVHEFGKAPIDFEAAKQSALYSFARSVDMSVEEISGVSIAPTVGQAEMAASGTRGSKGGLIRKLQSFAGEVVRDVGSLAKTFYTPERVTAMMGEAFTRRFPIPNPENPTVQAKNPDTGEPAETPSIWDLFRNSSMAGDTIEVVFSATNEDLMRAKSQMDFLSVVNGPAGLNPATQFPYKDAAPVIDKLAKSMGFGELKDFPVPEMPPPGAEPGGEGGGGKEKPPGSGSSDDRHAGGGRGPAPVPGRQGRGEGPGDVGDSSTRVNRVSTQ